MANTPLGQQLTQLHRRQQLALRSSTLRDVVRLWPLFDINAIDETWPPLQTALLTLIADRYRVSSGLSANYYRTFRAAEGATGTFDVRSAPSLNTTLTTATLTILGPIAAKKAVAARRPKVAETTLTRLAGSVGRQVLEGGRQTLQQSIKADPKASGWRRVTDSSPCDFCAGIARQGVIGDDVDFPAHDHCGCTQEPSYR